MQQKSYSCDLNNLLLFTDEYKMGNKIFSILTVTLTFTSSVDRPHTVYIITMVIASMPACALGIDWLLGGIQKKRESDCLAKSGGVYFLRKSLKKKWKKKDHNNGKKLLSSEQN